MQDDLYERALAHRNEHTRDVTSIAGALEAARDGFARLAWDLVEGDGERELNAEAVSVRCLQRRDGSMPASDEESDLVAYVAKSY